MPIRQAAAEKVDIKISELASIMQRLRADDGCPWDKEQTHNTLKQYLLEEAYEVLEAIEDGNDKDLKEELGDLLFQVLFHTEIARGEGRFTLEDVITTVSEKMIRRHPHVFGDENAEDSDAVLNRWEQIKKQEKKRDSLLDGVPKQLPTLIRAKRLQSRAARVGFDWAEVEQVWDKVEEEWGEFQEARQQKDQDGLAEELGDLIMSLVNLGRFLNIDADEATRAGIAKFERRFRGIEKQFSTTGKDIHTATLEEMEEVWNRIRQEDKKSRQKLK